MCIRDSGIGTGANDYARNYEIAKAAMDLALGRGGDQAVIKDGDKIYYYGGKSQQMEKNTRVKVRVKAHALRQILEANDNVLIMGHSLPDIDSFGSALGIYIIAKKLGKEAHIVFGEVSTSAVSYTHLDVYKRQEYDYAVWHVSMWKACRGCYNSCLLYTSIITPVT